MGVSLRRTPDCTQKVELWSQWLKWDVSVEEADEAETKVSY